MSKEQFDQQVKYIQEIYEDSYIAEDDCRAGPAKFENDFVDFITKRGVLQYGDFITKSGRKADHFFNFGKIHNIDLLRLSFKISNYVKSFTYGRNVDFDTIYGSAYKAIPLCVGLVMTHHPKKPGGISFAFNRKEKKAHGEGGKFLGKPLSESKNILIVDDVITSGMSIEEAILAIRQENPHIETICSVVCVDRQEASKEDPTKWASSWIKEKYGVDVWSLITKQNIIHGGR